MTRSRPSPLLSRLALAAVAALLAISASGCATASRKGPELVWPPPPEIGRIRFEYFFREPKHLERSGWQRFASVFVPEDPEAVITEPTGIALAPSEQALYVVSAPKARVVRVDLAGGTMKVVCRVPGAAMRSPYGIAVDADENVYVSDRLENRIFVYAKGGSLLRRFGEGKLQIPGHLAIDRRRQLLYVVTGATQHTDHRVEVFSLAGQHLRTIGRRGEGPGEFNFPSGVAVAPDGNVYVTDMLNFRIQVFSPEGELQTMFGQLGAGAPGTFDKPKGLAFDAFGNLYVVESLRGVHVYSSRFQPLLNFAAELIDTGGPIVISSKNEIYIGDFSRAGVHKLQLINTKAEDSLPDSEKPSQKKAPAAQP